MSSPIRIKGLDKLNATLKRLPPKVKGSVLRQALRKGAKLIESEAKSRVTKKGTGGLKRALTTVVSQDKSGNQHATVGANKPDGSHIHLVEFGTSERLTTAGSSRGRMPSQPFLRPAFDSRQDAALGVVAAELDRAIAKAAR